MNEKAKKNILWLSEIGIEDVPPKASFDESEETPREDGWQKV